MICSVMFPIADTLNGDESTALQTRESSRSTAPVPERTFLIISEV